MRRMAILCAALVGAVLLAGCSSDDSAAPEAPPAETVATAPAATEASPAETAPAQTSATPAKPKPTTVTIRVIGGVPQGGIARPKVKQGDRVVLVIRADAGESVHVHGYKVESRITPGKPARLPVDATIPGRFEVELHEPNALLAVLTVNP